MATEDQDLEQDENENESSEPEYEVSLGGEDDEGEGEEKKQTIQEQPHKSRKERREEERQARTEKQFQERLSQERERIRQELQSEFEARQPQRRQEPEPQAQPQDKAPSEVSKMRKKAERLLRDMRNPETPDDEVKEIREEYQQIQEEIVRAIAQSGAPKAQPAADPVMQMLHAEFSDVYGNPKLLEYAKIQHNVIKTAQPYLSDFAVARQALAKTREDALAYRKKQQEQPSAGEAAKYGSTRSGGARDSSNSNTVRLTKQQRDLALHTYANKTGWTDEKKIQTWAKKQKEYGML